MVSIYHALLQLSAIDFHCSKVLDDALAKPALRDALSNLCPPGVDAAELAQRAMWLCSSSLNVRAQWRGGAALSASECLPEAGVCSDVDGAQLLRAARYAEAAAAKAQAAAAKPGGGGLSDGGWAEEAAAAVAAVDPRDCGGTREAALLGSAWIVLAPTCRSFACEQLRALLSKEGLQRRQQQEELRSMSHALLLRVPPPFGVLGVPAAHPQLDGLFLVKARHISHYPDPLRTGPSDRHACSIRPPASPIATYSHTHTHPSATPPIPPIQTYPNRAHLNRT